MLHSLLISNHGVFARCIVPLMVVVSAFLVGSESQSQEAGNPDFGGYLAAGEFSSAIGRGLQLPVNQRDFVLAQVAGAQGNAGETTAANGTIRGIESSFRRDDAIAGAGGGAGGGSLGRRDAKWGTSMGCITTNCDCNQW